MRIVVTGGTGKGGSWVVQELRGAGHDVRNVDIRHDGSGLGLCVVADLTDLGQTLDALSGFDAVVHFAAIPAPGIRPDGETFRINALSTFNVFAAAVAHRMRRVVWASSETVLGLPFDIRPRSRPSTRRSSRGPSRRTRCRSSSARRWRSSSPGAPGSGSSVSDLEHHGARGLRPVPDVLG